MKHRITSTTDVEKLLALLKEPIVGHYHNCEEKDHCAPIDFLSDALTLKTQNFTVWANRSGSKSYLAALITWALSSSLPRLETSILGGSFTQSEKVYKGFGDFWALTDLQDEYLISEPSKSISKWRNGSAVSVLTASSKSVRGPHPQHLIMDEIDEMDETVYNSALSQPQTKHKIRSRVGKLSTNHRFGGMMDQAINQALLKKEKIYKWCIWETLESCKDYACSTCPLTSFCPGIQMKRADGYYLIDDFVDKLSTLNLQTVEIEWFCRKIGRSDLVYGDQYDEATHAGGFVPGFNPGLPVFLSFDWGGTHPFSVGAWQYFESLGWVRIDMIYEGNTTNPRIIEEAKSRPWFLNAHEGVGDPSRPDLIKEWAAAGIKVIPADNDIDSGLEAVRNAMRPVFGRPLFFVNHAHNKDWLREISSYYQRKGRPVKENDHAMDETRYFVKWKMGMKKTKGWVFIPGRGAISAFGSKAKPVEPESVLEQDAYAYDQTHPAGWIPPKDFIPIDSILPKPPQAQPKPIESILPQTQVPTPAPAESTDKGKSDETKPTRKGRVFGTTRKPKSEDDD